jgi:hypothetical protein
LNFKLSQQNFLLKKCVFEHRYPILLDRFSWFCFAFEILCCAIFCIETKQLWKGYLVAASESIWRRWKVCHLVFFLYPFAVNCYVLEVILCLYFVAHDVFSVLMILLNLLPLFRQMEIVVSLSFCTRNAGFQWTIW